jgi:hypothetical protein
VAQLPFNFLEQQLQNWLAKAAIISTAAEIRTVADSFIIQSFLYPAWSGKSPAASSPVLSAAVKNVLYIFYGKRGVVKCKMAHPVLEKNIRAAIRSFLFFH